MKGRGFAWSWVLAPPALNIPLFLGFAFATRMLVNYGAPGMDAGGALWFSDLTAPDSTFALPAVAAAATYTSLHVRTRAPAVAPPV